MAISLAFLKVLLIGLRFMELRAAPRPLRLVFEAWTIVVGGVLITLVLI